MQRLHACHDPVPGCRLLIVAGRPLLAEGLHALFRGHSEWDTSVASGDLERTLRQIQEAPPDLVLLDMTMPDGGAFSALWAIRRQRPAVRAVLLDDTLRESRLHAARKLKAAGYFTQDDTFGSLLEGLRRVARGETALSAAAQSCLALGAATGRDGGPGVRPLVQRLTRRELEIAIHLSRGQTVRQCAAQLRISPNTVDNHKSRLMNKLGLHKLADLVRLAIREKLLD